MGALRSRILQGFAMQASGRCTSPICATRTATSSAASIGFRPTSEPGDRQREQGARRPAAGREACVRGHGHRHDLLDLPAASGGSGREAAGRLVFVGPDTSPRGEGVPDDHAGAYDLGLGAGFYVDATQEPYAPNYRMWTYV